MQTVNYNNLDWYRSNFETLESSINGESSSPIHLLRRAAIARFAGIGFPTIRDEEWRFTNIAPITEVPFKPVLAPYPGKITRGDISRFEFAKLHSHSLVFINGHFSPELSSVEQLPPGAVVGPLAAAIQAQHPAVQQHLGKHAAISESAFTALNTAYLKDGGFVYVPDGVALELPISLLFLSTELNDPHMASPRNLFVVGKNAQAAIVERYVCLHGDVYFTNAVTEIVAGENGVLELDKLQEESVGAFHIGTMHVLLNRGSDFTSNSVSLGGAIVRNNITAVFAGEGGECTLNGLSLGVDKQLIDNHTTIDHAVPHCNSHELYKAIMDGKARGVFNGKIFVRKDAQKTDAKQTNKTLLLSDDAIMDTKPQLEIFADDVKCTHGATVGFLDPEQIFYLRSRGIDSETARDILTYAFASDVTNRIKVDAVRTELDQMLFSRLQHGRQVEELQ